MIPSFFAQDKTFQIEKIIKSDLQFLIFMNSLVVNIMGKENVYFNSTVSFQ